MISVSIYTFLTEKWKHLTPEGAHLKCVKVKEAVIVADIFKTCLHVPSDLSYLPF